MTEFEDYGDVLRGDVLNQTMLVEFESGEQKWVPLDKLTVVDAKEGVADDDWADDLDVGDLMEANERSTKNKDAPRDGRGKTDDGRGGNRNRNRPKSAKNSRRSNPDGRSSSTNDSENRDSKTDRDRPRKKRSRSRRGPKGPNTNDKE